MSDEDGRPDLDWFGNPLRPGGDRRPVPTVPCPVCGLAFDARAQMHLHLSGVHGVTEADVTTGRRTRPASRLRRWVHGLAFLPFWFVVPINLGITGALAATWWNDAQMFAFGDQTGVAKAWVIRLSLLPVTCYLAARVVDTRTG